MSSVPRRGGWSWLLAPDGSPSTAENRNPSRNETRIKQQGKTKTREPKSNSYKKPKNKGSIANKKPGWHWLLAPDGSHYPIKSTTTKVKNAELSAEGGERTALAKPYRVGAWNWLLDKDGSHYTLDTALTISRKRKREVPSRANTEDCILTPKSDHEHDDPLETHTEEIQKLDAGYFISAIIAKINIGSIS